MDGSQQRGVRIASPASARPAARPADPHPAVTGPASPRPAGPGPAGKVPAGPRPAGPGPAGKVSAGRRPSGKRRRRSPGWVPNQHGAWAMVIVPALAGVLLSGPSWRHVPLLGLWWVGYFEIGRASCRERVGGLEVAASRTQQDRKIRTL